MAEVDGRRRRWFACDVNLATSRTGAMIYEEFGSAGLALWACLLGLAKRSPIEGQLSFNSPNDLLGQLGLVGLNMVNEAGDKWDLDTFLKRLGHLKQTRRTQRGHLSNVVITRWGDWQKVRGTRDGHTDNGTSDPENTDEIELDTAEIQTEYERDTAPDNDSDMTVTSTSLYDDVEKLNEAFPRSTTTEIAIELNATESELALVRRYLDLCEPKCRQRIQGDVLRTVRELLGRMDATVIDEGIGKIVFADTTPQTAGYLRTTVMNWAAVRGVA